MGCRILVGVNDNGRGVGKACFYDSVTDTVFGELFESLGEAEAFQKWIGTDLRLLSDKEFSSRLGLFREMREQEAEQ